MPWFTNKETGGHFNTDWIDEEKTKERQINANKEQAAVRNSQDREYKINPHYSIDDDEDFYPESNLDPRDYKNDEYAKYLASSFEDYANGDLYTFYHKSGKTAFVHIFNRDDEIDLDAIGSQGKGAGTEAFLRVMENAAAKNKAFHWGADNDDSNNYYSHLGLDKYAKTDSAIKVWKYYTIPAKDVASELIRLRKKYPKK